MNQLNQIGIGVMANNDFLKSHPDKESPRPRNTVAGAVAVPEKYTLHDVNNVLPKVAILLCTYHGQRYLAEQLDSFAAQTHSNWEVWASATYGGNQPCSSNRIHATCGLSEKSKCAYVI